MRKKKKGVVWGCCMYVSSMLSVGCSFWEGMYVGSEYFYCVYKWMMCCSTVLLLYCLVYGVL